MIANAKVFLGQQCLLDSNVPWAVMSGGFTKIECLWFLWYVFILRLIAGISKGECHVKFASAVGAGLKSSSVFGFAALLP